MTPSGPAVALLAGILAASPAKADTRIRAAEALLCAELAQMRVSLACNAVLPLHDAFAESWTAVATDALETLHDLPGTEGLIAILAPMADPEALMLPPAPPFAEVRALCRTDPDGQRRADTYAFWGLGRRLETILTE